MDAVPRHQCLIYEGSPAKHFRGLAAAVFENLKKNKRCFYLNSGKNMLDSSSYFL
jgi:hypothetical protein